jgi:hypothetical protein
VAEPLTRAEIVRKAAHTRWSNPDVRRSVRLDELTPQQRRLVLALVDAAKSEAAGEAAPTAVAEVPSDGSPAS